MAAAFAEHNRILAHARYSALHAAFAELLEAHEKACASGRPFLTNAGLIYICRKLLQVERDHAVATNGVRHYKPARCENPLPSWDSETQRLWLGMRLLKEFRQPAPNQTTILGVFEEQGWATRHIEDPLPRETGETQEDAKRRLHETLKNLNRNLPADTIRFRGDGSGQGVTWKYDGQSTPDPSTPATVTDGGRRQKMTSITNNYDSHPERGGTANYPKLPLASGKKLVMMRCSN